MAFCQVWCWIDPVTGSIGRQLSTLATRPGHLGLALQTPTGQKTYITMVPTGEQGQGYAQGMPDDLRTYTGIGMRAGLEGPALRQAHADRANDPAFVPRTAQQAVAGRNLLEPRRVVIGVRNSVGPRASVGPGNAPRMSLTLAAGQVIQEPIEIIDIPVLTSEQLGVDTQKMYYWWKSYAGRAVNSWTNGPQTAEITNRYKRISTHLNCAGTVYLGLRVGGATYFKGRSHKKFTATPRGVRDWARQVKESIEDINRAGTTTAAKYARKRTEFYRKIGSKQQRNDDDLPTVDEWKRISHVGLFARRRDQIETIDGELRTYHSFIWDAPNHTEHKSRALDNIIRAAEEHARTKPMSDRSHAVSYLISKAWEVLEQRLRKDGWNDNSETAKQARLDERAGYRSLAFTDEEFNKLFMNDEWLVEEDLGSDEVESRIYEGEPHASRRSVSSTDSDEENEREFGHFE